MNSIVMCVYNCEAYIAEAIRSCLNQTVSTDELVIVNDGSTDGTADVIHSFKDHRITIYEKENTGLADSKNYGCERAQGDILLFADADDVQLPNKVEDTLEAIKGVDFSYTGYNHANIYAHPWEYVGPLPMRALLSGQQPGSGASLGIRRRAWKKVKFRADIKINEDLAWFVDAYNAGLTSNYKSVATFNYRMLPTGISYGRQDEIRKLSKQLYSEVVYDPKKLWNERAEQEINSHCDTNHEWIIPKKWTDKKVLEVGCGTGRLSEQFKDYTGMDISEKLIDYAKKKYPKAKFFVQDMRDGIPDGYELIITSASLMCIPDLKDVKFPNTNILLNEPHEESKVPYAFNHDYSKFGFKKISSTDLRTTWGRFV